MRMISRFAALLGVLLLGLLCVPSMLQGQGEFNPNRGGMLSPEIDVAGRPFSYFFQPTDILGTLFAPVATEITPEGYLYTGFGELMFFTGNPPEPVQQRIRTLYKDHLPVVQYDFVRHGVRYGFTMFAAEVGGQLRGLPLNLVRVQVSNEAAEQRTAFVSAAYRFTAPHNELRGTVPDYRFGQRFDLIPKQYTAGQTEFNRDWQYTLGRDALVRDGRVLYLFPYNPEPYQKSLALADNGLRMVRYFTGETEGNPNPKHRNVDPQAPMGFVTYRLRLKPGEQRALIFKYPIVPLPENSPEIQLVREAAYQAQFERTRSFWEHFVAERIPLRFPEAKVQNALIANTIYSLLAVDKVGDDYIPVCNKFQYHSHPNGYVTGHIVAALGRMGFLDISRNAALYSLKTQRPDGQWGTGGHGGYWGYFGEVLTMWGQYYKLTRDGDFLERVYPAVMKGVNRIEELIASEPLGLLPTTTLEDDEMLKDAHFTGQNLRTLQGLLYAIVMAEGKGNVEDVARQKALYQRYRAAFDKQLAVQTEKSGGYIPPSLDRTLEGNDWDNLLLLHPEPLFEPFDPRVTATIAKSRKEYAEGILTYVIPYALAKKDSGYLFNTRRVLHYWQTPHNSHNALVRGTPQDQHDAVDDLYALLLHTSSTHAPQEYGTYPWGTRNFSLPTNIMPMMATSGRIVSLLREMLVREYKNDLFLFSAVSPSWIMPGAGIDVVNLPTDFGSVSLSLKPDATGWTVKLSSQFRTAPGRLVVRLPWFCSVSRIEADGRPVEIRDGQAAVPVSARVLRIRGTINPQATNLSYEAAVDAYKREYRRRYQIFLRTGAVGQEQ